MQEVHQLQQLGQLSDELQIAEAEADAAPRIGSRRRLLVDSQLLQRHGRWNAGAFYARLLKSEPDGTVPKKRDWLTIQTDRPPRDMKVPNPGAYVGSRFSHLPVASSFQVNAEWTKLIDVTVRGVETPEGWTLVELSGVGPWGIVTTNDPARDQIFIAAR